MSGGSYNYKYLHVLELSDEIESKANGIPHRLALAKHMRIVAEACRAVEWRDSGDYGNDQELRAIALALGCGAIEAAALERIRNTLHQLAEAAR